MLKKDKMVSYGAPGCINSADNNSDFGKIVLIVSIVALYFPFKM